MDVNLLLTLRAETFSSASLPMSTGWLLADCMEPRGKQDLWLRQKPEVLRALRQQAMVQSVESSNRIEGVVAEPGRLRPVVLGTSLPRNRSEEELAGYRNALEWIFGGRGGAGVRPQTLLRLHALAQGASGDAGEWKRRDNEIIEVLAGGRKRVRFVPTPAKLTPLAVKTLCESYGRLMEAGAAPPLLLIATMVFDFLCIHPFRDGNGRVSRLLTTLLLEQEGFVLGRFVSLERLVEESKADYYRVLGECSAGWALGRNPIVPWWNYFLGIVRRGYGELARQVEEATRWPVKTEMIRRAAESRVGVFTLAELTAAVPGASTQLVKKVLQDLRREGRARLEGRGRAARWEMAATRPRGRARGRE